MDVDLRDTEQKLRAILSEIEALEAGPLYPIDYHSALCQLLKLCNEIYAGGYEEGSDDMFWTVMEELSCQADATEWDLS